MQHAAAALRRWPRQTSRWKANGFQPRAASQPCTCGKRMDRYCVTKLGRRGWLSVLTFRLRGGTCGSAGPCAGPLSPAARPRGGRPPRAFCSDGCPGCRAGFPFLMAPARCGPAARRVRRRPDRGGGDDSAVGGLCGTGRHAAGHGPLRHLPAGAGGRAVQRFDAAVGGPSALSSVLVGASLIGMARAGQRAVGRAGGVAGAAVRRDPARGRRAARGLGAEPGEFAGAGRLQPGRGTADHRVAIARAARTAGRARPAAASPAFDRGRWPMAWRAWRCSSLGQAVRAAPADGAARAGRGRRAQRCTAIRARRRHRRLARGPAAALLAVAGRAGTVLARWSRRRW